MQEVLNMNFDFKSFKNTLKNETKTLIIAGISIIVAIFIIIFVIYKVSTNKATTSNNNSNENQILDLSKGSSTQINDVITIYLFKRSTCPHCNNALTFFKNIKNDYPYIEIKAYEVTKDDNNKLLQLVAEKLNDGTINAVPYIVIGSNYSLNGYGASKDEELKEAIEDNYTNINYNDIVEDVIKANPNLKISSENY